MQESDPHARSRTLSSGIVLALAILAGFSISASASAPVPEIVASVAPAELTLGAVLSVTGRLTSGGQGLPGVSLALQSDPYPFRRFAPFTATLSCCK